MKKTMIVFLFIIMITGCAIQPVSEIKPNLNEEQTAYIGDVFFSYLNGKMVNGITYTSDTLRYELIILELNNEKMGLQYNEFVYQSPQSTGYLGELVPTVPGGWMVKQGFNKRFDYTIADKSIHFKSHEFEILGVEKGQIRYRRIK